MYSVISHEKLNYLLLFVSITAAVANSVLLHKREITDNRVDPFMFNGIGSVIWITLLVLINKGELHLSRNTVLYGIIYGAVQILFLFFKLNAMERGAVSVTTLIGNCSMIFSVIVSMILWNEPVEILQWLGIAILLVGVAITSGTKKSGNNYDRAWSFYVTGFFVLAGMVGIVFKMFSAAEGRRHYTDMFIIAAIFMSVCNFVISLKSVHRRNIYNKRDLFFAFACGVMSCVYNRLNAYLAGTLPGVIFFPVFNGSVIILSAAAGVIICKEKLSFIQLFGFALGVAALLLIGKVIV